MRAFKIPFSRGFKMTFEDASKIIQNHTIVSASSEVNDFIPYHALITGLLLRKGKEAILLYDFLVSIDTRLGTRNYEEVFRIFTGGPEWNKFQKKGVLKDYRVRAGQLIEVTKDGAVIPLLLIVVNKAHMLNIDKENPDPAQFLFVVNKVFIDDLEYRPMYNAARKYLLDVTDVNVMITNNINKLCYKHKAVEQRRHKTISEAKHSNRELTQSVLRTILYG